MFPSLMVKQLCMNRINTYLMRRKKEFEAPQVLQAVDLQPEEDILAGPSQIMTIMATGQEVEDLTPDAGYDNPWLD